MDVLLCNGLLLLAFVIHEHCLCQSFKCPEEIVKGFTYCKLVGGCGFLMDEVLAVRKSLFNTHLMSCRKRIEGCFR